MKNIMLFVMLVFTSAIASAGIIPATYGGLTESGAQGFTLTDANTNLDDSNFQLDFRFGLHNTSYHEFGLFQYDRQTGTAVSSLTVFDSSANIGTDSNVVWDLTNQTASSRYGSIDLGLDEELLFGAWFKSDGFTSYSVNSLNANNEDFFGFFWETDPFNNANLYIYASDNDTGGNLDFMYASVSDVAPVGGGITVTSVPEPTGLALMGLAISGLAFTRKKAKQKN